MVLAVGWLVEAAVESEGLKRERMKVLQVLEMAAEETPPPLQVLWEKKLQLEAALGARVRIYHRIMAWLVRHVGWLIFRFAVRQSTGMTSYQILRG